MSFSRLYFGLFLFSIIVPIHLSVSSDLTIYFDRAVKINNIAGSISFPISFFFALPLLVLWGFENIKYNFVVYLYMALTSLPVLFAFGFTSRFLVLTFHVIYYFSLKYIFERINNRHRSLFEINLNYYLFLFFILVFIVYTFGGKIGLAVYDMNQYILPVLSSIGLLFFLQKRNMLICFLAGLIYYLILFMFYGSKDSSFVQYALYITFPFAVGVRLAEKLKIDKKAIAILSFILINSILLYY